MQIKDAFQVGFNRYDSVNTNIVWPLEGVQSLKMMTDSECREEPLKIINILIIFLGVCSFIIRPFVILISMIIIMRLRRVTANLQLFVMSPTVMSLPEIYESYGTENLDVY